MRINRLRNAHKGETAYLVGRGPSLLDVTAEDFGPGPVVAMNAAILNVRALNLPNVVYSMQKDGCTGETGLDPCEGKCPARVRSMVRPVQPEILLIHRPEPSWNFTDCFRDYRPRYTFSCQDDLGIKWNTPSTGTFVQIARLWGISQIVLVAHDALKGELRRVDGTDILPCDGPYADHAEQAFRFAENAGIAMKAA